MTDSGEEDSEVLDDDELVSLSETFLSKAME
jgi:hypothetical protein